MLSCRGPKIIPFIILSGMCLSYGFSQNPEKDSVEVDRHYKIDKSVGPRIKAGKADSKNFPGITNTPKERLPGTLINLLTERKLHVPLNMTLNKTNTHLDEYKTEILVTGGLFIFSLFGFGLLMGSKQRRLNATAKQHFIQLTDKEETIKTLGQQLALLVNENRTLKSNLSNSQLFQKNNIPNFFGQILLSAGPRKTSRDSELGEDIAGFCINENHAFFWVLDGTSDSPIIIDGRKEIMSSRLLAQHLGVNLQKGISNNNLDSKSWLKDAIEATEKQWKQTISDLSSDATKVLLDDLSASADIADVSTTALVGILDANGKASVTRIGDSKIFCLDQEGKLITDKLAQKPPSELYSRLYARATKMNDSIELSFGKSEDILRSHNSNIDGVKTVLAFSDGIGPITENFLREHFNKFPLEDIQQTITGIPQQTYDDKSLVMIQIR